MGKHARKGGLGLFHKTLHRFTRLGVGMQLHSGLPWITNCIMQSVLSLSRPSGTVASIVCHRAAVKCCRWRLSGRE